MSSNLAPDSDQNISAQLPGKHCEYAGNTWLASQRTEVQILMWCCRPRNRVERPHHLQELLNRTPNWQVVWGLARRHRVSELLYFSINRSTLGVPRDLLDKLSMRVSKSAILFDIVSKEICDFSMKAASIGIEVIHLKGATLSISAYKDGSLRAPGDMDMLVRKEHVQAMLGLLKEEGYQPTVIESRKSASWSMIDRREVLNLGHELTFKKENGRNIDLHWALMKPSLFTISTDTIWSSTTEIHLRGQTIRVLEPSLYFIFLARHAAKHGWTRVRWIADLIALIDQDSFDFDELLETAARHRYKRFTLFALELVSTCAAIELPARVRDEVKKDRTIESQVNQLLNTLFPAGSNFLPGRPNEIEVLLQMSTLEDGICRRVKVIVDGIVAPTLRDWERFPLFDPWCPLLSVLRPVRLLIDYSSNIKPLVHRSLNEGLRKQGHAGTDQPHPKS